MAKDEELFNSIQS